MTRLLLADDHAVVRRGLRHLIEAHPGWHVCAEAANGREAVALAQELAPDVALLDVAMPELNGIEATRRIRSSSPHTEVLIFSMYDADHLVHEALKAGARGFVLKSDPAEQVIAAVEALSRRNPYLTSSVTKTLLDVFLRESSQRDGDEPATSRLTSREREIVQLLAEGRGYKDIAQVLSISPKTVEAHRAAIMRKLDLQSAADLVRYAVRNGIVQP
jgi:DNA-binding NarL/FixJ family response regulator